MKNDTNRHLFLGRRLISLWDMIQWTLNNFVTFLRWIEARQEFAAELTKKYGREYEMGDVENQEIAGPRKSTNEMLVNFLDECQTAYLTRTYDRVFALHVKLFDLRSKFYWSDLESGLDEIQNTLQGDLILQKCIVIHPDKMRFFERDGKCALFGESVYDAFDAARAEIKSAGTCMALDLNTAAVFHLVRAAEVALVELAKKLKVKRIGRNAVSEVEWQKILDALDLKIAEAGKMARGPKKRAALKLFRDLSNDCKAIKDKYRNPVCHGTEVFSEPAAMDARISVERFMAGVASSYKI